MRDTADIEDRQRLTGLFQTALAGLGVRPPEERLAELAEFVHRSMSGHGREYHGVEHVFDVAADMDPVQTLAGLYHDVVYVQADGRIPDFQTAELAGVVEFDPNGEVWPCTAPKGERARRALQAVFAVQPGGPIPLFGGLNEFLSASLALRHLEPLLPLRVLVRIGACIEATIPFRGADESGRSASQALFERLQGIDRDLSLDLAPGDIERTVYQAVGLACRDVASFACADTAEFLDSTWKLLAETNVPLRRRDAYSFGQYQRSLAATHRFLGSLDARRVFPRFLEVPDDVTWNRWTEAAERNIGLSRRYLGVKLVTVSIMRALAQLSGGDAPMSLFMGQLPEPGRRGRRLEAVLGPAPPGGNAVDGGVLRLLEQGRRSESRFDLRKAPLSAHIYNRIGDAGIETLLPLSVTPMTDPQDLLAAVPAELLGDLARACGEIAGERREALSRLAVTRDQPPR